MDYPLGTHGSAPAHLRRAFLHILMRDDEARGSTVTVDGRHLPVDWLLAQLWNCTDTIPQDFRDQEYAGASYAQAARIKSVEAVVLKVLDAYDCVAGLDATHSAGGGASEYIYPFYRIFEMLPFDQGRPPDEEIAKAAQRIITDVHTARAH